MKKTILFTIALYCCSFWVLTACSDDYNDATSKHVYGECENPYLRIDPEAQISISKTIEINGKHSYSIDLSAYETKFEEKMGMSLEAVLNGLETGEIVFYPINTTRNQWLKVSYNKDNAGWYFNSASQPCSGEDDDCKAFVVLDKVRRELKFELTEAGVDISTLLEVEIGFAKNGPDYDNYVRFTLNTKVVSD